MCPAGRIALRSLIEIPITLESPPWGFNSSPTVLTRERRGDVPGRLDPVLFVSESITLETVVLVERSYHSLPMMPLSEGVAPERKVEWPTAVTVAAWM